MCKECQAKDKIIAKLERILKKAQVCNDEKYRRIKHLEGIVKNLSNNTLQASR